MKKVMFVAPFAPNPRVKNRADALYGRYRLMFIYWDRTDGKLRIERSRFERLHVIKGGCSGMRFGTLLGYISFISTVIKNLRADKPDIIHSFRIESLAAACVYKAFFDKSVKIAYEVADLPSCVFPRRINAAKRLMSFFAHKLEKRLLRKTALMILTSPAYYDFYYGKFTGPVPVVIQEYIVRPEILRDYKRDSIFPEAVTMAFYGNMRYLNMIEAASEAVRRVENARLQLAGFTQCRSELENILVKYPGTEYYGLFDSEELGAMYGNVDIIYSVYDTDDINARVLMSNKFYEAVMLGLPVVVAEGTYMASIVSEKGLGYTVSGKAPGELALILKNLDREEMARIRANCEEARRFWNAAESDHMLVDAYKRYLAGGVLH